MHLATKYPTANPSLEPDELKHPYTETRDTWLALGKTNYERQQAEAASKVFRRSLYFVRDPPADHIIGPEDIRRIRPGQGLPPKYYDEIIGCKTT